MAERVRQGVENLKISCDSPAGAAIPRSPSTNSSTGSPSNRHSEASLNLQPHEGRVFKTHPSPKVRKVKMRSRQHRAAAQQRLLELRAFRGPRKIYRADESNFRELVYQHTCQIGTHIPSAGLPWEPSSPLAPQGSISTATSWSLVSSPRSPLSLLSDGSSLSSWDVISPLSSPITSPGGSSNSTSPVCSPHRDL